MILQAVAALPNPLSECPYCATFVVDAKSRAGEVVCPRCGEPPVASKEKRMELDQKLSFAIVEAAKRNRDETSLMIGDHIASSAK